MKQKKIGINACVEQLGREFVIRHKDTSCSAYGDRDTHAFCFVGVDTEPDPPHSKGDPLMLDGGKEWPVKISCNVWYNDGHIEFFDCKLPEAVEAVM